MTSVARRLTNFCPKVLQNFILVWKLKKRIILLFSIMNNEGISLWLLGTWAAKDTFLTILKPIWSFVFCHVSYSQAHPFTNTQPYPSLMLVSFSFITFASLNVFESNRVQLAYVYQLQGKNDEAQKLYNQVLKSKYAILDYFFVPSYVLYSVSPSALYIHTETLSVTNSFNL